MNQLQVFKNDLFGELPILVINGTEWIGATEAASTLSFSNPYDAIKNHVDEDDLAVHEVIDSLGRKQKKKFTNESGFYSLIFGASKQGNNPDIQSKAKEFKRWVTSEVLPTIRKHGAYLTPETLEQTMQDPDFLIGILNGLKSEQEARKKLELKLEQDKPKVLFAESLETSRDCILVANLAKLLKQNGIDTGEKRLYRWLRENGYLGKMGDHYNMPTQRSMELRLFEVKTRTINNPGEDPRISKTTVVTGRGQMYFLNKFKDMSA